MNQLADHIAKKILKSDDGCWIWCGCLSKDGYGLLSFKHKTYKAHRFIYQCLVGPVQKGLCLDHLCRVRNCVNPDHLEQTTNKANVLRGDGISAKNKAKTHCKHGHEFTPENTVNFKQRDYDGMGRECRTCKLAKQRRWKAKRRALAPAGEKEHE